MLNTATLRPHYGRITASSRRNYEEFSNKLKSPIALERFHHPIFEAAHRCFKQDGTLIALVSLNSYTHAVTPAFQHVAIPHAVCVI